MAVIVERVETTTGGVAGKVITASWYDGPPTRHVIWESSSGFFASVDEIADILYISRGPAVDAYAVEDDVDRTIWYRYADADDSHAGVTIFAVSRKTIDRIVEIASQFLGLSADQLQARVTAVLHR